MKQLDKKVLLFFLVRCIGVFMGLITITYQYQFTYELKQFFHQYIFLSLFVYLFDGGYSEKITQNNPLISKLFFRKTILVFVACVALSFVSYYCFSFNHIYLKWLLASTFIIPFQMYADVLYRIILKSTQSLSFIIYQALSPTIILLLLILALIFGSPFEFLNPIADRIGTIIIELIIVFSFICLLDKRADVFFGK